MSVLVAKMSVLNPAYLAGHARARLVHGECVFMMQCLLGAIAVITKN